MKSIAIIGANSFLAKKLISELRFDYQLHLYARNESEIALAGIKPVFREFYYPMKSIEFNELLQFDTIIYTAAAGVQANKDGSAMSAFDINFYIPLQITTHLNSKRYKGKIFTFGSYFEIGNNTSLIPYTEDSVISTLNAIPNNYCDSKRLLSRHYSNKQFALNWYHLIIPSLYGPGENDSRLIPYVVNSLITGAPLKTSSGEQVRQYLYVDDLVNLIRMMTEQDIKPDVYNVAGENQPIQVKEMVALIYQLLGKNFQQPEGITTRDQGMLVLSLNDNKLKKAAPNWRSEIDLANGIKTYF